MNSLKGIFYVVRFKCNGYVDLRFVAFPATEYDEVLLGYQPGQMVEQ
jgi:hypothetical protein